MPPAQATASAGQNRDAQSRHLHHRCCPVDRGGTPPCWLLRDSPPRSDCRFAWAAYVTYTRKHPSLPWILGITALLFNPFIKIHTSKEAWSRVNVASAILLLTTKAQFQTT
jgi:hypothetical protein